RLVLNGPQVEVRQHRDNQHAYTEEDGPDRGEGGADVPGERRVGYGEADQDGVEDGEDRGDPQPGRPDLDRPRPVRPVPAQQQESGKSEEVAQDVADVAEVQDRQVAGDEQHQQHVDYQIDGHRTRRDVEPVQVEELLDRH